MFYFIYKYYRGKKRGKTEEDKRKKRFLSPALIHSVGC